MAEARRHAVAPQLVLGFGLELIACNTSDWVANPELLKSLARGFLCGSLFLFDRKVLRYFRKDGHSWRKKKDGKTVKEAHERLKSGSVDVLHCYYAHGEGNENFQRRSYWMLEEDFMHIVLVHYLEVKVIANPTLVYICI
ncbi:Calmodulin-binding transcription activator 3 [Zea mays]|uniref:Calmodulin-binding transcription activator 3 n=1 Tax=Zea mays TaxID=4577 RepID=A0A317YI77_MAIZE|nr:Calmodulin-binding transcription activator 3 [Zea mays]